jgi:hypothetical protein
MTVFKKKKQRGRHQIDLEMGRLSLIVLPSRVPVASHMNSTRRGTSISYANNIWSLNLQDVCEEGLYDAWQKKHVAKEKKDDNVYDFRTEIIPTKFTVVFLLQWYDYLIYGWIIPMSMIFGRQLIL